MVSFLQREMVCAGFYGKTHGKQMHYHTSKPIAVKNEKTNALYWDLRFWLAMFSLLCLVALSISQA